MRMEAGTMLLAAGVAAVCGWFAASYQHLLYREPEFRANPTDGRRKYLFRAGVAAGAALVAALAFRPGYYSFWPALLTAVFGFVLVVLSSTDFERRRLPNALTYPAILAALALSWAWPDRSVGEILPGFAVGLAAGALLFALGMAVGGGLGMGDAKLMVLIGVLVGWPAVVFALFLGMIFGGVPALFFSLTGRGRMRFSYGPYLAAGGIIAMLWLGRVT